MSNGSRFPEFYLIFCRTLRQGIGPLESFYAYLHRAITNIEEKLTHIYAPSGMLPHDTCIRRVEEKKRLISSEI